ncbi:MAG: cysteine desulfurase [Alphaproteobacteria bacterium]|nr:cysteine desulfurase [Alphaproteobacteria bacterium]
MDTTRPLYFDYQSSTPCHPEVVDAMLPWFRGSILDKLPAADESDAPHLASWANPHNTLHAAGRRAAQAIEDAREELGRALNAPASCFTFTGSATEGNNHVILGAMHASRADSPLRGIITSAIEHPSVLQPALVLQQLGFPVRLLETGPAGLITEEALAASIDASTALVSLMLVNSEIGTISNIKRLAALCRARGILFHSDISQAVGKIPVDLRALGVDFATLSAHKFYGPKAIGALYVRKGLRAKMKPFLFGGGQEGGLRSGTLSPALCVGLGTAARLTRQLDLVAENRRQKDLSAQLQAGLRAHAIPFEINGDPTTRIGGNVSITFTNTDADAFTATLVDFPHVAFSLASACAADKRTASHVLTAIGRSPVARETTVRVSMGRGTNEAHVTDLIACFQQLHRVASLA